jgi:hypothetical protein
MSANLNPCPAETILSGTLRLRCRLPKLHPGRHRDGSFEWESDDLDPARDVVTEDVEIELTGRENWRAGIEKREREAAAQPDEASRLAASYAAEAWRDRETIDGSPLDVDSDLVLTIEEQRADPTRELGGAPLISDEAHAAAVADIATMRARTESDPRDVALVAAIDEALPAIVEKTRAKRKRRDPRPELTAGGFIQIRSLSPAELRALLDVIAARVEATPLDYYSLPIRAAQRLERWRLIDAESMAAGKYRALPTTLALQSFAAWSLSPAWSKTLAAAIEARRDVKRTRKGAR